MYNKFSVFWLQDLVWTGTRDYAETEEISGGSFYFTFPLRFSFMCPIRYICATQVICNPNVGISDYEFLFTGIEEGDSGSSAGRPTGIATALEDDHCHFKTQ